jgi:NAD(P)H-quinone oxidoreductase subunit K
MSAKPEAIMDALIKLWKKIANESLQERSHVSQTHRYYTCVHNMKIVPESFTGQYLRSPQRQEPLEIAQLPLNPALPNTSELESVQILKLLL